MVRSCLIKLREIRLSLEDPWSILSLPIINKLVKANDMKIFTTVLLLLMLNLLFAQQKSIVKIDSVIIDSNLTNDLFNADKHSKISFVTTSVVASRNNGGKTDSVQKVPEELDIIVNCKITESERAHYPFDNCSSLFKGDTLLIHFRNNHSSMPIAGYHDKIIIYILKGKFYIEYLPSKSSSYKSPFSLVVKSQKLIFKKIVTHKGERLMGELRIEYFDQNPEAKIKILTFAGPFDCTVQ